VWLDWFYEISFCGFLCFCGDEKYARTDAGRLGWVGPQKTQKSKKFEGL
jgi:hypothetical protein